MTVQTIIKKAIKRLELEGKILTPDFYAEAFCKEAKIAKIVVEDCNSTEKFTKTLNKEFQKELVSYRVSSMQELTRFLISKLNRTNPTHCSELLGAQTLFTKRVLQVVEVLHNKEASDLARKSIELLDFEASATQIDQLRQLWVNFITTYDDTFLYDLKVLGDIDSSDLRKSIQNLDIPLYDTSKESTAELSKIATLFVATLVPSIASSVNYNLATLSNKLKSDPDVLKESSIESEIKAAISLRIALDKKSVREMITSLDGVLDKLSLRLIDMIDSSESSTLEIQKIKKELEHYNEESSTNFKIAHKKLFTIAVALEENTRALNTDLKHHNSEVDEMAKRIKALEEELNEAKEEAREDFLTKLYNKRALHEFMAIKEKEYNDKRVDYSIVMFDLDHFKEVNDTFGHDAGDAILGAFAKILKKESRDIDIVGRFGGEEFVAILHDIDLNKAVFFAEKVREHVEKSRFMYKGKRIEVTVSCGVAQRSKNSSVKSVVNSADEYLYKAKQNGRNSVVYK